MSNFKKRSMSSSITKPLPKISTPTTRAKASPISFHSNTSVLKSKQYSTPLKSRIATQISQTSSKYSLYNDHIHFSSHIESQLQPQIDDILNMFKTINKLRQKHGVIELRQNQQDQDFYLEHREVPYHADLADMNEEICAIKRKIQQKIERVIKMVKYYPKYRNLISSLLEESAKDTLNENIRVGRMAAMKARRRLILTSQREQQKIGI